MLCHLSAGCGGKGEDRGGVCLAAHRCCPCHCPSPGDPRSPELRPQLTAFTRQECPLCLLHSEVPGPGDTVLSLQPKAHRLAWREQRERRVQQSHAFLQPPPIATPLSCSARLIQSPHVFWKVKRLFHSEHKVGLFITIQAMRNKAFQMNGP